MAYIVCIGYIDKSGEIFGRIQEDASFFCAIEPESNMTESGFKK